MSITLQTLALSILIATPFSTVFPFQSEAIAQEVPACTQIEVPQLNDRCYQSLQLRARADNLGRSTDTATMTAFTGWVIYALGDWSSGGRGVESGPSHTFASTGTVSRIEQSLESASRELRDRTAEFKRERSRAASGLSTTDSDALDAAERTLEELSERRHSLTSAITNNDIVEASVTVKGYCVSISIFGVCDERSGAYNGHMDIYMRYVGTPEEITDLSNQAIAQLNQASHTVAEPLGDGLTSPNYILGGTRQRPAIAVFEGNNQSFALGCSEIRAVWDNIPSRIVDEGEVGNILSINPLTAHLRCDGSIRGYQPLDGGPGLLLITHTDDISYRHYINSPRFLDALNSGDLIDVDGPSFRAEFPNRGNDLKIVQ